MIPESLDGWRVEIFRLFQRWRLTARRGRSTWLIVQLENSSWAVTRMRGGKILSDVEVKNLPPDVLMHIPTRDRRKEAVR